MAAMSQVMQQDELLRKIFGCMDIKQISRAATVCRRWRLVAYAPELWTAIDSSSATDDPDDLRNIILLHNTVSTLKATGVPFKAIHLADFRRLNNLKCLEVDLPSSAIHFVHGLGDLPSLNTLVFDGKRPRDTIGNFVLAQTTLNDDVPPGPKRLRVAHPGLKQLSLKNMHPTSITITCPQLTSVEINRVRTNSSFVAKLPKLESIVCTACSYEEGKSLLDVLNLKKDGTPLGDLPLLSSLEIRNMLLSDGLLAKVLPHIYDFFSILEF